MKCSNFVLVVVLVVLVDRPRTGTNQFYEAHRVKERAGNWVISDIK